MITCDSDDGILKCNGQEYRQTGGYGLEGFEQKYFWSPDWGLYVMADYYPALPADAMVADLCDSEGNPIIRNLQVSNSISADFYDQFVTIQIMQEYRLKTLPKGVQDGGWDNFRVTEIEFTNEETTVRCEMTICQTHSFPGYINDFKMIFPDGTELAPTRVDGAPVGEDFDRHGDFVCTYFQLIFPKLDSEQFSDRDAIIKLTGNVCHEPVELQLIKRVPLRHNEIDRLEPGKYFATLIQSADEDDADGVAKGYQIKKFLVNQNGTITVEGDVTGHLKDGTYSQEPSVLQYAGNDNTIISISLKNKTIQFLVYAEFRGDECAHIELIPVPEDLENPTIEWRILLTPREELQ